MFIDDLPRTDPDASTTAAIAPRDRSAAMVAPAANLSEVERAFETYQRICSAVLKDEDHQKIGGRKFRKRSAWRKLGIVFNVSVHTVRETINRMGDDAPHVADRWRVVHAEYVVRAVAPNGRTMEGFGECDVWERCCLPPQPDADGVLQKTCNDRQKHNHCPQAYGHECLGWSHFSHANHDVPATAQTRAINRAFSDMFGMGDVSAEELAELDEAEERAANLAEWDAMVAELDPDVAEAKQQVRWETAGVSFDRMDTDSQRKWIDWLRPHVMKARKEKSPPEPKRQKPPEADTQELDLDDRVATIEFLLGTLDVEDRKRMVAHAADVFGTSTWQDLSSTDQDIVIGWLRDTAPVTS